MKETWALIEWLMEKSLPISIFLISLVSPLKMREIVILRRGCPRISPPRKVECIGLTLGIFGMLLTLVGVFMPIYMVEVDIQTPFPVDRGEAGLIVLDGWNGIQTNISPIMKLPSISYLQSFMRLFFLASIWFTILDIVEIKRTKHIGDKQVRGGSFLLSFLIIVILLVSRLNLIIEFLSSELREAMAPVAAEAVQRIASQPLQGTQTITVSGLNLDISWGIGTGYFVILAAAIIKITGGIILRKFWEPGSQELGSYLRDSK